MTTLFSRMDETSLSFFTFFSFFLSFLVFLVCCIGHKQPKKKQKKISSSTNQCEFGQSARANWSLEEEYEGYEEEWYISCQTVAFCNQIRSLAPFKVLPECVCVCVCVCVWVCVCACYDIFFFYSSSSLLFCNSLKTHIVFLCISFENIIEMLISLCTNHWT